MLVDMYCDKLIQSTYSKAEYPFVVEQAVKTYKVEKTKCSATPDGGIRRQRSRKFCQG